MRGSLWQRSVSFSTDSYLTLLSYLSHFFLQQVVDYESTSSRSVTPQSTPNTTPMKAPDNVPEMLKDIEMPKPFQL